MCGHDGAVIYSTWQSILRTTGSRVKARDRADDASGEKPVTHLAFLRSFFDDLPRRGPAGK
jgi:hypothetical protein